MEGFSVIYRNYGHWDIATAGYRAFCIRGGPGRYYVRDERRGGERRETKNFKTVMACMAYICDELMFELIVAEGQEPQTIQRWNV